MLKEIKSFDRENNAELIEAQKLRKDEFLAAWKLRYYIEYLRLRTTQHLVEVLETKNQDLEEECSLLQQSSAVAEIENESLTKEIARLTDSLAAVQDAKREVEEQLQDCQSQLETAQHRIMVGETATSQAKELVQLGKLAAAQTQERVTVLESELAITRLTCQELVRSSAQKDTELRDMTAELKQLRALHEEERAEIVRAREEHLQELENAKMREEDNEIRYRKTDDLHATLSDREKTIRHLETETAAMAKEIAALKEEVEASNSAVIQERGALNAAQQEKTGLQKLLSELALRLTQADEEAIKHGVVERQHRVDAKTAQNVINEHLDTIQELEDQATAAHSEIEFLVEENHELAREIECHHMYGEEMMTRYLHTFSAAERHQEYSRFLEEELFCARKLYEKTSTEYRNRDDQKGNPDTFGDVSEESYGYRNHRPAEESEAVAPGGEAVSRSFIENWTGLEPVAPLVVHLNSFSKGSRRSSKGRGDFERPNSASMYNPESRPNSTNAAGSSLVAEQRLLMVLSQLEEKMRSVDRAADSLRYLAEKADAIEKVQKTTASMLRADSTAAAMARMPVRVTEQLSKAAEEKQGHIDEHINMERAFADMHAALDEVTAQLTAQQDDIAHLQERKTECKNSMSDMKKLVKKSRKASMKDPNAVFMTEEEESRTETAMGSLADELEELKERISACKAQNLDLNARSIALQTDLYHLDQNLERSASRFLESYGEHITAYYPPELAHLIESADGHVEEHGHFNLPHASTPLNTLYEEDEWSESVHNAGEGSLASAGENPDFPRGGSLESGMRLGDSIELASNAGGSSVEMADNSSLDDQSDLDAPFSGDSPFTSKSKKHKKASKSGMLKSSKGSKSRKSKKHRRASSMGPDAEGSSYELGNTLELEEGSSGVVEDVAHPSKANSQELPVQALNSKDDLFRTIIAAAEAASHTPLRERTASGSPSPTRRPRTGTTEADRLARQQMQQTREYLAQLRVDLERCIVSLDSTLDEMDVLEERRYGIREKIARWVENFYTLCGYYPERSDKLRSRTLQPDLEAHGEVQRELVTLTSKAIALSNEAQSLRASLIREQHQQLASVPVEQLGEQIQLLYPISEFDELLVEDPLTIAPDTTGEGEVEATTEATKETVPDPEVTVSMDAGVAVSSDTDGDAEQLILQMERALAVFAPQELRSVKAAAAAKRASQVQHHAQQESVAEEEGVGFSGHEPSVGSADSTTAVTTSRQASREALSLSKTPFGRSDVNSAADDAADTSYTVPTTPFAQNLAGHSDQQTQHAEFTVKFGQSAYWAGMFADSVEETTAALQAENNRLKLELRVWAKSVEARTGRRTGPELFHTFEAEFQEKISRKGYLKGLLASRQIQGEGVHNAVSGMADTEESSLDGSQMGRSKLSISPRVKVSLGLERASSEDSSSDASFPTTPFALMGALGETGPDRGSSAAKSSKSAKWASMFSDPAENAPEALVAEQNQLKTELRQWAQSFLAENGHKPLPEEYDSFDEEIKRKIFRKNQLKIHLAQLTQPTSAATKVAAAVLPTAAMSLGGQLEDDNDLEVAEQEGRASHSMEQGMVAEAADIKAETDAYSVPTTPFTAYFPADPTTSPDRSSANHAVHTSTGPQWKGLSIAVAARSIAQSIDDDPTRLREELKQIKQALRGWSAEFTQTHGRSPQAEDFESFDEDAKALLFRKNQIKEKIERSALNAADEDSRASQEPHEGGLHWPLPSAGAYVEVPDLADSGAGTAERRHLLKDASRQKSTAHSVTHEIPPQGVVAVSSQSSVENTTVALSAESTVQAMAAELSSAKQALRKWQKDFKARTGREPERPDLTADVLALGERRDELRSALVAMGREDLVSTKSSKYLSQPADNTVALQPQLDIVSTHVASEGLEVSVANAVPSQAAAPAEATPTPPVDSVSAPSAMASSPLSIDGMVVSLKRLHSKRVSFLGRDSDDDSQSASSYTGTPNAPPAVDATAASPPLFIQTEDVSLPSSTVADAAIYDGDSVTVGTDEAASVNTPTQSLLGMPAEELGKEYSRVKKQLKARQREFAATYGREPGDEDFESLDEAFQELVVRKYELRALLDEGDGAAGGNNKSGKKRRKSKSSKHAHSN